jgi:predicted nucleic acid-binding protein
LQNIALPNLAVSVVTTGELFYGARDKSELLKMQKHLALMRSISLDEDVSNRFLGLLTEYALSHRLNVPDALIVATALSQNIAMYTLNVKDFRFIPDLEFHTP